MPVILVVDVVALAVVVVPTGVATSGSRVAVARGGAGGGVTDEGAVPELPLLLVPPLLLLPLLLLLVPPLLLLLLLLPLLPLLLLLLVLGGCLPGRPQTLEPLWKKLPPATQSRQACLALPRRLHPL